MIYTNKNDLPQPIVDAIIHDPYTKGNCDYSVSELLSPARIRVLRKKHDSEIEEDVIDSLWILLGHTIHHLLEKSNKTGIAERRLYAEIGGKRIGGGMDILHKGGLLQDYKLSNTYKIKFKDFKDWEAQLNIYNLILFLNGEIVSKLEIVAILRDWVKSFAKKDPKYPQKQLERINLPIWPISQTQEFVVSRIKAHDDAETVLPECTSEERWANYKNHWVRCEGWCSVNKFCTQYQNAKKAIKKGEDDEV